MLLHYRLATSYISHLKKILNDDEKDDSENESDGNGGRETRTEFNLVSERNKI
jgi:hypothetical protein